MFQYFIHTDVQKNVFDQNDIDERKYILRNYAGNMIDRYTVLLGS